MSRKITNDCYRIRERYSNAQLMELLMNSCNKSDEFQNIITDILMNDNVNKLSKYHEYGTILTQEHARIAAENASLECLHYLYFNGVKFNIDILLASKFSIEKGLKNSRECYDFIYDTFDSKNGTLVDNVDDDYDEEVLEIE